MSETKDNKTKPEGADFFTEKAVGRGRRKGGRGGDKSQKRIFWKG